MILIRKTQPDVVNKIRENMMKVLKAGQSFLSYAQIEGNATSHGHAMIASIGKNRDGIRFEISIFNSGFGLNGIHEVYERDPVVRDPSLLHYRSHYDMRNLPYVFVKDYRFEVPTTTTSAAAINRLYSRHLSIEVDSTRLQPWHYINPQKADTCSSSSLWVWMRSLGADGIRLEIKLKMQLMREVVALIRYFEGLKKKEGKQVHEYFVTGHENASKLEQVMDDFTPFEDKATAVAHRHIIESFPEIYHHARLLKDMTSSSVNEITEHLYWLVRQDKSLAVLVEDLYTSMIEPYAELLPEKIEDIAQAYEALEALI